MHISEEGLVAGSVNRAELAEAYASATDKAVRANLAAAGAEHGMHVERGRLIDPSVLQPTAEPEPTSTPEPEPEPAHAPEPEPEPAKPAGRKAASRAAVKE